MQTWKICPIFSCSLLVSCRHDKPCDFVVGKITYRYNNRYRHIAIVTYNSLRAECILLSQCDNLTRHKSWIDRKIKIVTHCWGKQLADIPKPHVRVRSLQQKASPTLYKMRVPDLISSNNPLHVCSSPVSLFRLLAPPFASGPECTRSCTVCRVQCNRLYRHYIGKPVFSRRPPVGRCACVRRRRRGRRLTVYLWRLFYRAEWACKHWGLSTKFVHL